MKRTLFTILFLTAFSMTFAQTSGQITANQVNGGGGNNAIVSYLLGDISSGNDKREIEQKDVQGSAYTNEQFLPASVYYGKEFQDNVFFRYNAYYEQIEIKNMDFKEAPVSALATDKKINLVLPDGKVMSFKTFIDKKGLTQNGYLTTLNDEGKYKLYKRVDVKFTEGQRAQNSFVKAIPARFSKFTAYYIEVPQKNRIDELELSNRKLVKLVADDQKEALKQYLKENKIRIKSEEDVYKALRFLNR